jgi:hypothetical protein
MFRGVCVAEIAGNLENMPPVNLSNLEEAVRYTMLHKGWFKEVIIEDEDEYCILHAKDGKIVFPVQFAGR